MIRNTSRPHIEEAETTIVHDHEMLEDVMFGAGGWRAGKMGTDRPHTILPSQQSLQLLTSSSSIVTMLYTCSTNLHY